MTEAEKLITFNLKHSKVYPTITRICTTADVVAEWCIKEPLVIYRKNTPSYHYMMFDRHSDSYDMARKILVWMKRLKLKKGQKPKLYICGPRGYRIERQKGNPVKIGTFFYRVFEELLRFRQDFSVVSCGQTGIPLIAMAAATAIGLPVEVYMTHKLTRRDKRLITNTPKEQFFSEIEELRIKIKENIKENIIEYIRKDSGKTSNEGRCSLYN